MVDEAVNVRLAGKKRFFEDLLGRTEEDVIITTERLLLGGPSRETDMALAWICFEYIPFILRLTVAALQH